MEIAIKNNQRLIKANHRAIERVLNKALTHLAYKGRHPLISGKEILEHLEVSVLLVNDAAMRRLNHLYRGIDRTTDVLSFPLIGEKPEMPARHLSLGDIVISLPQAKRQAEEYGATFDRELARLLIHGLLHLLGHDHEKSSYRAAKMRRLEAELAEVVCL
jgi:probable rRNA maturation factor